MYETQEHPVFCTGVAMAQILYYWYCRIPGDYMWINMHLNIEDVYNALLIYDCCVACERPWFPGSSTPRRAKNAFIDDFGISSNADVKWRISHLLNWKEMLKDEIDLERPLLYSAGNIIPIEGHSWVIDGYNQYDEFWCNWGWDGDYNNFYSLGGFSTPNGDFNEIESAIFNVVPIQTEGVAKPQLTAQTFMYNPNGYTLSVPEAYGATSYEWITQYGTISGNERIVTLYTDYTTNVQVRAYNNRCEIYSSYDSETITINYGPISGPTLLCSSGAQYSISNVPSNATITWSNGSYINLVSSQGSNPCTFKAVGAGSTWIGAQITTSHGSKTLSNYSIWAGKAQVQSISGPGSTTPYTYNYYYAYANYTDGTTYDWMVWPTGPYVDPSPGGVNSCLVIFYTPGGYQVLSRAVNACGTTTWCPKYVYVGGGYYSMYPNPASDEVTITINEPVTIVTEDADISDIEVTKAITPDPITYTILIYNSLGTLVTTAERTGTSFDIPLPKLRDGTYIVELNDGKNSYREQLIIKHE